MTFVAAMVLALYSLVLPVSTPVEKASGGGEAVAFAMHAYHKAAVTWCENDATTCADGPPTRDQMPLPGHFDAGAWLRASIASRVVVTYAVNPPVPAASLVKGLIATGINPDNVGIATEIDGAVRLQGLGRSAYWVNIALPGDVPVGAPVIVTVR